MSERGAPSLFLFATTPRSKRELLPSFRFRIKRGSPNPDARGFHDHDTTCQESQIRVANEPFHESIDRLRPKAAGSEENDAGMASRGKLPKVAEFEIESQKDSPFRLRGRSHDGVRFGQESLVGCGRHILLVLSQNRLEMPGEVLVQLQFHEPAATFQMFSRDSSAA